MNGSTATAPALELRGVSRTFGIGDAATVALADVDLAVGAGEFVAVMGPSGSGKSTVVNIAAGLDAPDRGSVLVGGATILPSEARRWAELRRRRIGVVYQRLNLVPTLTAAENVMVPLVLDGVARRQARDEADAALASAGVGDVGERLPVELSGGQQQRVAIARALVGRREVLLADEPTGALDSATSDAVVRTLADRARAGAAVLMVTHDGGLASWADRVVFLRDGRVMDDSAPPAGADA